MTMKKKKKHMEDQALVQSKNMKKNQNTAIKFIGRKWTYL